MKIVKVAGIQIPFTQKKQDVEKPKTVLIPLRDGTLIKTEPTDTFVKNIEEEEPQIPKPKKQNENKPKSFSEQLGFRKREPKKFE